MTLQFLLLAEDSSDAERVQSTLKNGGIDCELLWVTTHSQFVSALEANAFDLILADYLQPTKVGLAALDLASRLCPNVPLIVLSGSLGEELAIETIKQGATDYVLKQRLERLVPCVQRALRESEAHRERQQTEQALQQAQNELEELAIQLEQANEDLKAALEEVQITEEELRQQNEQLAMAQEAIAAERQRYQDLFNFAPDGYVITDIAGVIQEANWAAAELMGCNPSQLIGVPLGIYIAESDYRAFQKLLNELGQPPQLHTIELGLESPERSLIPVAITATAIHDAQGQWIGARWLIRDITERKQIETALRQSETILNAFIASSPVGMAFFDRNWRYVYANAALAATNGIPLSDHLGRTLREVLPQWAPTIEPILQQVMQTKTPLLNQEVVGVTHPVDLMRYGLINYFPVCLPDGEVIGVGITSLDITERKQVEVERERLLQTLADERAQFEAVLRQMPEGVMIADAVSGQLVLSNEQADQILQHAYELNHQLEQYEPQVPFQAYDLDGHLYAADEYPLVRSLRTGEVVIHEEMELRYSDGSRIFISTSSAPVFNSQGQLISAVTVFQDITERKQSEEALRQALQKLNFHVENTPMAVIEWDGALRITRWSGAAESIFGWSAAEVLGQFLFDLQLVFEDDIDHVAQVSNRLMGAEPYVFSYNRNYTKQGDVIHCEWYNSSLRDEAGRMISVLSLVLNVTDRVQTERDRERILQQAQAAREAAEAANRIKDEFLAVVSHELRAPLNPIVGWAKLLRSGQLDAHKSERAIEVIERNAQMQSQLINDLLDISRILRGKLSLDPKPVDLVATIQAAMETVRLAAEAKAIQIHTQLAPDVGAVSGDAGRLQQVVWNLLSNAVKFTPEGGRVEVRLEREGEGEAGSASPSSSYARITITDTGKGIAPDFLPYVFDHFRQESSATTRRFGGLGLGLAIVRYLVELHGGTVQADSAGEGQGATFTVRLPLMPHQLAAGSNINAAEPSLNLQGTRILVVDDDANTREFLAVLLELHGANVIATATASEALTTLTQFQPDILLSDIGMPDVDGYMLVRQIRTLPPEQGGTIPAIALTAYAGEIDYQQAMAAGFQQHIPKPLEPTKLVEAIAHLVRPKS
nr:MAG: hybrid sensor histidine kinase/response regulator [Leptolyngbya sp. IPPAS B-1204]